MRWPFRPMASEPTILEPAAAVEPSILVHWLSLYIGCVVCMVGIILTRQAYKLSPDFQARWRRRASTSWRWTRRWRRRRA